LGAAGAFSIHVFGSFMCFYHGCEGPFTFLAISPTIGLTHRLFGTFFPAVSRAHCFFCFGVVVFLTFLC